jgi:hypothetical protein
MTRSQNGALLLSCAALIRYSMPVYPDAFLNHLVRPHQHVGRNRQPDLLGRLEIDDQLDLIDLLVLGFNTSKNPLDVLR